MTNIDIIIELINARSFYYWACEKTAADGDEHDWNELRPLYAAKREVLADLAMEIQAAQRPPAVLGHLQAAPPATTFFVLSTEMGGMLTARMFNNFLEAEQAKVDFQTSHGLECDTASHACCNVQQLDVLPRPIESTFDARFAVIKYYVDPGLEVSVDIFDTPEEADAAESEHREWEGSSAWCSQQPVLIPWLKADGHECEGRSIN